MKNFIMMILAMITTATLSFAEDDVYPLDIQMRVYPEEIHYGDACFLTFFVTNQGPETLLLPYGTTFLHTMGGVLEYGDEKFLFLHGIKSREDRERREKNPGRYERGEKPLAISYGVTTYSYPGHPVKPGETMMFHARMAWLPMPEFAHHEPEQEFLHLVNQGERDFKIMVSSAYRLAYRATSQPEFDANNRRSQREDFSVEGLNWVELEAKGYKLAVDKYHLYMHPDKPECSIRILPRPQEEIDLLLDWYLELGLGAYPENRVFATPDHVNGSLYKTVESRNFWFLPKDEGVAYQEFCSGMETRTPEAIARIERTNELAAKIIERSKEPDSTFSQNMVEFIQLRGYLVDMRYAENDESEEAAFQKLMDFIDVSQDKELWIDFLYDVGLGSIENHTHFPYAKVYEYRQRFAERMEIKNLCRTFEDYDRIYGFSKMGEK